MRFTEKNVRKYAEKTIITQNALRFPLYIAQAKEVLGIKERKNHNKPKKISGKTLVHSAKPFHNLKSNVAFRKYLL